MDAENFMVLMTGLATDRNLSKEAGSKVTRGKAVAKEDSSTVKALAKRYVNSSTPNKRK